jgi:hypothetical protein
MGDPFVGIVHPCKVYNIRALGIPYLYIGPDPSPITEMSPPASAEHGNVEAVVRSIQAAVHAPRSVRFPDTAQHGQRYLVSRMVLALETLGCPEKHEASRKTWQIESEF